MLAKRRVSGQTAFLFFFLFSPFFSWPVFARMMVLDTARFSFSKAAGSAAPPNLQQCTHKAGRLWFTLTNFGTFGNRQDFYLGDCLTGGLTASAEFPGGSRIEYLYQGALWVGGIVGEDTLTSIGTDGWVDIREFFPDGAGEIVRRSNQPNSPYYSPEAKSDLDLTAVFYDTLTDPRLVTTPDPQDGKFYRPLGLKVVQRSYSWSADWGRDWVLVDYQLTNIGKNPIKEFYAGIFVDPDVGYALSDRLTQMDDLAGIRIVPHGACLETLYLAYAYDNDGDPERSGGYEFTPNSAPGALGFRVLRAGPHDPSGGIAGKISFNWWAADNLGILDWGPQKFPGKRNFSGGLGQPEGDRLRYFYLSNGEIDYDQLMSALDLRDVGVGGFDAGWLPPLTSDISPDLANGADSRFLLSFGPFDLAVGDSVPLTFVVIGAEGFHHAPADFDNAFSSPAHFGDTLRVMGFRQSLSFGPLIENSRTADNVFDTKTEPRLVPCLVGIDQETGDSLFAFADIPIGDGIPDLRGPLPPPLPKLEFSTAEGEVTIRWFGKETERAVDPVSGLQDFEGYEVLMSPDGVNYTILGHFDRLNWRANFLVVPSSNPFWALWPLPPYSYEEIQNNYAIRWDSCNNEPGNITHPIDPQKYNSSENQFNYPYVPSPDLFCNPDTSKRSIRIHACDRCGPARLPVDTLFYFEPEGLNLGMDPIRMYPSVTDPDNDSAYWYQYKLTGLFPSQPVWLAVVPFDNGFVTVEDKIFKGPVTIRITEWSIVGRTKASPYGAAQMVQPLDPDSLRRRKGSKISVYPNPYRVDEDYSFYETRLPASGLPQSFRQLNFINLPPECTIRIYTLDGDLVQLIEHDKPPEAFDSGYERWDLLSRNAQLVTAGLYLYSVQSEEGTHVGKIIIIK